MKKFILLTFTLIALFAAFSSNTFAQVASEEDENCNCGKDEDGECLPCEENN